MTKMLDAIMGLDHVILIMENGMVMDYPGPVYAPTCMDDELDDTRWEFFSIGYTGQHRLRNTPWMHNSEYIGGRLEKDILSTPGVYAAIVCQHTGTDEDDEEIVLEGWCVVRLKD
jgi:hypothetical protein